MDATKYTDDAFISAIRENDKCLRAGTTELLAIIAEVERRGLFTTIAAQEPDQDLPYLDTVAEVRAMRDEQDTRDHERAPDGRGHEYG